MDKAHQQELVQSCERIIRKLNILFSLFGGDKHDVAEIQNVMEYIPPGLELCLIGKLPESQQKAKLAIDLYEKLIPESTLLESLISSVPDQDLLSDDVKDQIRIADTLLAIVHVYMAHFLSLLKREERNRNIEYEIEKLENQILAMDVDDNLILLISSAEFNPDLKSKSLARTAIINFTTEHENACGQLRELMGRYANQVLPRTPPPPWPPDRESSQISQERRNMRREISNSLLQLSQSFPGETDGNTDNEQVRKVPNFSPKVAAHIRQIYGKMRDLGFKAYLESNSSSLGDSQDLSLKNQMLDSLVIRCLDGKDELKHHLAQIMDIEKNCDETALLPNHVPWIEALFRLKTVTEKVKESLAESSSYLKTSITYSQSFASCEKLQHVMEDLRTLIGDSSFVVMKGENLILNYDRKQSQLGRAQTNYMKKIGPPELEPKASPSVYAVWEKELESMFSAQPSLTDQSKLRTLKDAVKGSSLAVRLTRYAHSYQQALDALRGELCSPNSIPPDLINKVACLRPVEKPHQELHVLRELLSVFRMSVLLDFNPCDIFGRSDLYNQSSLLCQLSREKWEEIAIAENLDSASAAVHFQRWQEFLEGLLAKRLSLQSKFRMRQNLVSRINREPFSKPQQASGGGGVPTLTLANGTTRPHQSFNPKILLSKRRSSHHVLFAVKKIVLFGNVKN